ncbi:FAD-dependent oxidoreductase [Catenulispora sp. NF23]|uniref:FAD-dependent oxidoreductase n=1 Tax=Catenulispora pinistramenti TaxID=2705254 RepID=A0ABS5KZ45_9ACTN|nr:FAD-dependent oxidoreductase [Catenulispora pinistramenti]MBS2534697.1 FAD-dependent oxidoreductase [Catenulispora pinistramenti]MBS2551190.1 FAD-dependent oxidoreductase [Catenulispora pinistramenti]
MSGAASTENMLIIGASLAGAKAAQALREDGWDGPIELVGAEHDLPYERPPLSKGLLQGKEERDKVFVHESGSWYVENRVGLRLGRTATAIDRENHRVRLDDGTELPYGKLLLATGSAPRRLNVFGGDAKNLSSFRTLEDSERTKAQLIPGSRLTIIGAGWIGLEVAAAAREKDVEVTVLEALEQPLLRVLGPEVGARFAALHRAHDVDLRLGVGVDSFTLQDVDGVEQATRVRLADGTELEADHILVAVGAAPNTGLAEAAGLKVANGIVVDATLRSCDPDIFAAGDVANAWHPFYGEPIRVEHWANALNQPKVAAASMMGVTDLKYDRLPYFYTDQYDLGMEYVGHIPSSGYEQVVFRGDPASGEYMAFWLAGGAVLAGMNVNVWDVVDDVRALILSRAVVDVARLQDPAVALADVATA